MSLRIIVQPSELISLVEAAEFLRADFSAAEEDTIESMITAARQWCEEYLRRSIGVQTLELTLAAFPSVGRQAIVLPPPIISVTSLKYLDPDGVEQTLVKDTDFYEALDSEPGELIPVGAWPATLGTADSVRVRFQAGYSAAGIPTGTIELPQTIKIAMLLQISDLYENRDAQVVQPLTANPTLERLLSQHRLEQGI